MAESVSRKVREIVDKTPFLRDVLGKGFLNYSNFAQSIRDEVVGFFPTFTDFVESARRFGLQYRGVPMRMEENGLAAAVDLLPMLNEKTAFIYVDRPNNPTGQTMPLGEVELLCRAALEAGA